jgi:peptide/bleomycin uptake transporter
LAPTIVAGAITLGVMQQIVRAFGRVESSLQFPVHSRSKIVKLISIYKRLQSFEAVLEGKDVPHWGSQKID